MGARSHDVNLGGAQIWCNQADSEGATMAKLKSRVVQIQLACSCLT